MTWRRTGLVVTIVVAMAAVVGWRWWHNHPPYGPEALAMSSSLTFVSYEEAQAALGEDNAPLSYDRDQLVLGRVFWQSPPQPLDGGRFLIFLIDKRTNRKPEVFGVSARRQEAVGVGSDGADHRIAEHYPWLQGAGAVKVDDNTWRSNGIRVAAWHEDASPVTFVALFPNVEEPRQATVATAPVAKTDLLLALVYIGPDGQIYWAQRLEG